MKKKLGQANSLCQNGIYDKTAMFVLKSYFHYEKHSYMTWLFQKISVDDCRDDTYISPMTNIK